MNTFSEGGIWQLVSYWCHSLTFDDAAWPRSALTYTLLLRRRSAYYVINVVLPAMLLSFTSPAVFLLPADSGEKMTVGVTGVVAMSVYLAGVAGDLPQTSVQVCYLQVYLSVLLGVSALGVMLASAVLKLHHIPRDVSVGRKTRCVVSWMRKVTFVDACRSTALSSDVRSCSADEDQPSKNYDDSHGHHPNEDHTTDKTMTWVCVADTIDRFLFCVSSFTILASATLVFPYIIIKGSNHHHQIPEVPVPFQCFNETASISGSSF